ncbi:helix-turn-helix transcriptional regulator [Tsukamurella tyrosinosolvens]|uniref:DNA-binding transcriptional regulator, HxlR family n=1 Tax=Tsukamurella tyrosinosolvens TaxID=57704 RepID=A0A1H4YEQ4_TSUTY|nr:helix-turn-helix domain-containing protein [Tsukamurella tyrosinosolvens]KXP00306.1 HxlR family transcriptional regulator [Tsukamurella tyrosinosolvens]KXP04700.1 HxlR family transcriptional regulator [Tsukamurella tyrosinosolvens]KZL97953.1 HxlR family transcriptional regulator [Tsukamurella tyrosinosolvens]MCA4995407.1 helix-turn-helix transcriptional regulator [Tsukamurella tyrosinosolvens]MEC4611625.1 helix-turn-helix domain-containing protein [Tsukamurella tyrosinosolvens]
MATTTAAQRREIERLEYDAFLAQCPSRQLLEQLSSKWVTLLLCALHERPQRYSELSREVAGVSQKMLTQTLRTLERDGLISRDVEATVPVTVTYAITELGESLHEVVQHLKRWAESNMPAVHRARADYDAATSA